MTTERSLGASSVVALALAVLAGAASGSCSSTEPGGGPAVDGGTDSADGPIATDRRVVVLFTSDEHSQLFAFSPELDDFPLATAPGTGALKGGFARRATVLTRERKAASDAGKDSITVSAGDNHMGTLAHVAFETRSVDYAVLAALGYDATTIGNHELDFGPQAFAHAIVAAKNASALPPIVASNIRFSDASAEDDELAALYAASPSEAAPIHPYRIVTTKGGVRVGLLGWVGVDAAHVAPNKTPVLFSGEASEEANAAAVLPKIYADVQKVVDTLRGTEKVDLVVGLSHAGIKDSSTDAALKEGEDWLIASNVTGIDLVVSGHAHNEDPKPIAVANAKGSTLVLNASALGRHVGRVELVVHADGSAPSWDPSTQALLAIDDTIVPDATAAATTSTIAQTIEASGGAGGSSYLEALLSRVTGAAVKDDASKPGDLYFYPVGKTAFDVVDTRMVLSLSADAMLSTADAWGAATSTRTSVAIESAGVIRGVLRKGNTGVLSAADAFDVVPLGSSPVDRSIGYPLVRAYLYQLELRGVFEASIQVGPTNSDFLLGAAGLKVEYDMTRPPALSQDELLDPSKGRVVKMMLDTDHSDGFEQYDKVVFDRAGNVVASFELYPVVASSYVAQFAADVGATLKDEGGNIVALKDAILHRPDQSEIKQVEAFFAWLHGAPGGTLPAQYDMSSPTATKRLICVNGC